MQDKIFTSLVKINLTPLLQIHAPMISFRWYIRSRSTGAIQTTSLHFNLPSPSAQSARLDGKHTCYIQLYTRSFIVPFGHSWWRRGWKNADDAEQRALQAHGDESESSSVRWHAYCCSVIIPILLKPAVFFPSFFLCFNGGSRRRRRKMKGIEWVGILNCRGWWGSETLAKEEWAGENVQ
jgi:hypothetical protein